MAISRTKRWQHAVATASKLVGELEEAIQELVDLKSEYEEWRDNLPENLESSALGEKLEAIVNIDVDDAYEATQTISDIVSECENAELPLGFGRD